MRYIARTPLSRRTILRAAGATLALPFLDAMRPVFGKSADAVPRRRIAICTNLGLLERHLFPAESGRGYALTPYPETLRDFREQFTDFSGTSHPDVTGGHSAEASFRNDTLLDRTQILYGSNHDNHNLPVLLAGGGFKHGQHLAFDKTNNYPLPNLYVSMLQRLGIEAAKFAASTGSLRGLEMA